MHYISENLHVAVTGMRVVGVVVVVVVVVDVVVELEVVGVVGSAKKKIYIQERH